MSYTQYFEDDFEDGVEMYAAGFFHWEGQTPYAFTLYKTEKGARKGYGRKVYKVRITFEELPEEDSNE